MQLNSKYGRGDSTYMALGELPGIKELVDVFYTEMEHNKDYETIWSWHSSEREIMRDKLSLFLCMWSGGPNTYIEKYGSINIPRVHSHLRVTESEVGQWLGCMRAALLARQYPQDLIDYLIHHFSIPAARIRESCAHHQGDS